MKVLNVDMTLAVVEGGGTTERTFQMSRALAKRRIGCSILTTNYGLTAKRRRALAGVNIVAMPCLSKRFFIPRLSIKQLIDAVRDADVVHLMGHWTIINAVVYFFVSLLRKPYVICPAGALLIYGRSRFLKRIYHVIIGKRILKNAQTVIAITSDEIIQIREHGIPKQRIALIPNGIDPRSYSQKDDEGFRRKYKIDDRPFILFLGGLRPIKGPDILLRAFIAIKDRYEYNLVFAGNDRGSLNKLTHVVARNNIGDRVHFIGYVDGSWKSKAYHAADLLVIPSRHEAMSIVILEAGITATPVLLTDRCGLNEIQRIGGGVVVPANDEGIESGLREMLTDSDKLKQMGKMLYRYVKENYVWDIVIERYIDLYEQALKGKKDVRKEFQAAKLENINSTRGQ